MPSFGKLSNKKLSTCHRDIQIIMNRVVKYYDCSVRDGARTLEKQQEYFKDGFSKCDGITKKSKHQVDDKNPLSMAIDIVPYPSLYSDKNEFKKLAKYIFREWQEAIYKGEINHGIEWGGVWSSFVDLPHWQLRDF